MISSPMVLMSYRLDDLVRYKQIWRPFPVLLHLLFLDDNDRVVIPYEVKAQLM